MNNDNRRIQEIEKEIGKREKEYAAISVDYLDMKPSYFNSGCCCFVDGDITGIEIAGGCIALVKWTSKDQDPKRQVLENISLADLAKDL